MEKAKIMIVEDENIVAEDIRATLESLGYSVVGRTDTGEESVEMAESLRPDLILMDIKLKGKMDGIEATKKINEKMNIPIIFLTAFANESILNRAKHAKAFGYVVKPFEENNLNSAIQMAMEKHSEMMNISTSSKEDSGLDAYDRKILYEVDINSRISASMIGSKLRMPKGTVNYRIDRLLGDEYINKFYTLTNVSLLGYQYYRIFMKFQNLTPKVQESMAEFIRKECNCQKMRLTEGNFDMILYVTYKNNTELKGFLEAFNKSFGSYLMEKDILNVTRYYKFNQKFLLDNKNYEQTVMSYENNDIKKLDATDLRILQAIQNDARIKLIDLAKKLRIDWKIVKYRIEKMREMKIIVAFTADLNLQKMKQEIVQVDISVKDTSAIPEMIGYFNNTNLCFSANEMMGKYDLSVDLYASKEQSIENILKEFQNRFLKKYTTYNVSHINREFIVNSFKF